MAQSRFRLWLAYQQAFKLAVSIRKLAKGFPKEERYSLTDQITRSSRSVCANLAESYGRRNHPKYFTAKLNDCISENFETQVWLDFALEANYITPHHYERYLAASESIGRLLSYMKSNPDKFTAIHLTGKQHNLPTR